MDLSCLCKNLLSTSSSLLFLCCTSLWCIAPLIASSLQGGQFWAMLNASNSVSVWLEVMADCIHVIWWLPGGLFQSSGRMLLKSWHWHGYPSMICAHNEKDADHELPICGEVPLTSATLQQWRWTDTIWYFATYSTWTHKYLGLFRIHEQLEFKKILSFTFELELLEIFFKK